MVVEPIDYSASTGRALLQGLTAGRAIQGIRQSSQEMADAAAAKERQNSAYSALQNARPEDLPTLRKQYPEFADVIQKEIGIQDAEHSTFVNKALNNLSVAYSSGNPQIMQQAIQAAKPALASMNVPADEAWQLYQSDPKQFGSLLKASMYATLPMDKQFETQQNQQKIDETIRSNQAGEGLQARGQNITVRGQDISAATARRGQDLAMDRANGKTVGGAGKRVVQLSDGRTVNVGGKLHGAGANAFYEGVDDNGNMVRVPASAIAAPPTSAASAQNYAMLKDLNAILDAPTDKLNFMTGVTGGNGSPSWDAEVRSRLGGGDQRQLFNATKRIQGKMQNQGIAAARDMGASGINTVAEAKMYFQGMPQVDYSSPDAMQNSLRDIKQYTDQYNQQYSVDVGGSKQQTQQSQPTQQPQQSAGFSSLWGD